MVDKKNFLTLGAELLNRHIWMKWKFLISLHRRKSPQNQICWKCHHFQHLKVKLITLKQLFSFQFYVKLQESMPVNLAQCLLSFDPIAADVRSSLWILFSAFLYDVPRGLEQVLRPFWSSGIPMRLRHFCQGNRASWPFRKSACPPEATWPMDRNSFPIGK